MDRKVLLGAGIAALLVATLAGALFLEASNAPDPVVGFPVTWTEEHGPATTQSGTLEEGQNETYPVQVQAQNVTGVEVRLVWEDDTGDGDRFRLTVASPDGPERSNASRNGTIAIRFPIGSVPDARTINGTDRDQARQRMDARFGTSQGVGTWTVRVTLLDAPGVRPVSDAPQLETQPDGENDFTVRFSYERFQGALDGSPTSG